MVETHPFGNFVPPNSEYLILGSFTGKRSEEEIYEGYDWFYGSRRNHFWPILREVYESKLSTKQEKQKLFIQLRIAIADIIYSCERKSNSNLDMNLTNIIINQEIPTILKLGKIKKIYFSSRFVEKLFRKHFKEIILLSPQIKLITLPSPSPRYAAISRDQKIARYQELLPKL